MCQGCLNMGSNSFFWDTLIGDERVVPGSYSVHAETSGTYDLQLMPYATYFQR